MGAIQNILEGLRALFSWWFIVEPWEQSVRVRFGKHVRVLGPGIHFKIPFFDVVYTQNIRRRVTGIPLQTLTTADGIAMTVHGSIGYKVADILKLHMTLHDAEASIKQEILGLIAIYIAGNVIRACGPGDVMDYVSSNLDLEKYGLSDVDFFLTGYVASVPTFRLIQDSMSPHNEGNYLSTNDATSRPM